MKVSEQIWSDIKAGRYDTMHGIRPDAVFHTNQWWMVSYPGNPHCQWESWDRWEEGIFHYRQGEE
jgi:hypothetical protein